MSSYYSDDRKAQLIREEENEDYISVYDEDITIDDLIDAVDDAYNYMNLREFFED